MNYGSVVDPAMLAAARTANVSVLGNGCCPPQVKGCAACPRGWTRTPLLFNATQRQLAITGMVDFAVAHGLAGINLDIEGSPAQSAPVLSSFVCGLQAELKRRRGPSEHYSCLCYRMLAMLSRSCTRTPAETARIQTTCTTAPLGLSLWLGIITFP